MDGATHLEKFITNLQRERTEVAFHIWNPYVNSLALNLSERFKITDEALEKLPWPPIKSYPNVIKTKNSIIREQRLFKSKLRFQIRHGDFRERISQVNLNISNNLLIFPIYLIINN